MRQVLRVGEYAFDKFDLELEFRPEEINFEVTDRKLLISGIDYTHSNGEDNNYSSGELVNTSTKGTEISLLYKSFSETDDVFYDDILEHIDPQNKNENINEKLIKEYFEFILDQSKK